MRLNNISEMLRIGMLSFSFMTVKYRQCRSKTNAERAADVADRKM